MRARSGNRAVANRQIARAHELLGLRKELPTARRAMEIAQARSLDQQSLEILREMQRNGTLIPAYAGDLKDLPEFIARCERELASLR
ncbi:MAG: hypothetical protein LAO79_25190 [Acidobacteriia bacterium]|nr:hypothetical protein [Terriglobia bacterium]